MLWLSNHYHPPPPRTAVLLSTTPPPPAAAAAPSLGAEGSAAVPDGAPPPTSALLAPPTFSPSSMTACPRACCVRLEWYFLGAVVNQRHNMCCVVCVFSSQFILDAKFVGSTSRGHTGLLIDLPSAVLALIFLARRIQPLLSLVNCVHRRFFV